MKRSAFTLLVGPVPVGAAAPSMPPDRIITYRDGGDDVELRNIGRKERIKRFGLSETLPSFNTSFVGGYVVEGHIPPVVIGRLLRERPHIRGIPFAECRSARPGRGPDRSTC